MVVMGGRGGKGEEGENRKTYTTNDFAVTVKPLD